VSPEAVVELADLGVADIPLAGAKLARLGELARRGFQVPDGYAITAPALEAWAAPTLGPRLRTLLDDLPEDQPALARLAGEARELVERHPLPPDLERAVRAAHQRLEARSGLGPGLAVAVRSSSVSEDGAVASFAGQFETHLGVRGADSVLEHVRRCWSSQYTPRALGYRRRHGLPQHSFDLAVGVVRLVDARSSGVLFTLDPATGDRETMVVEANWGLGESVVSGLVTPDHFAVDRQSGRIRERRLSTKRVRLFFDAALSRVVEAPLPRELADAPCLADDEIGELWRQADRLERMEGAPQDVEWAIEEGRELPESVLLLQHRPETSWGAAPQSGEAHSGEAQSGEAQSGQAPFDPVSYSLAKVWKVPER
jgi:pyruvate,water dikinase